MIRLSAFLLMCAVTRWGEDMNAITRHGPRFTFLIGFDLGKPGFGVTRYIAGHYGLMLGWIEFHFMFGTGRDRTLDVLNAGVDALLSKPVPSTGGK